MKKYLAAIAGLSSFLGWFSGLCIAFAALLIMSEIFCRVALGFSLQVTDEYTGYLMAVSSFLGIAYVEQTNGHIRMDLIDLLRARCPRVLYVCRILSYCIALVFAAYLTYVGWRLFYQSYLFESKSMQISETLLAIPQLFIPLGGVALFLQYCCNLYAYRIGQIVEPETKTNIE
jgi:TRAP-type C4-dicarboxylate transport system permease small subunit